MLVIKRTAYECRPCFKCVLYATETGNSMLDARIAITMIVASAHAEDFVNSQHPAPSSLSADAMSASLFVPILDLTIEAARDAVRPFILRDVGRSWINAAFRGDPHETCLRSDYYDDNATSTFPALIVPSKERRNCTIFIAGGYHAREPASIHAAIEVAYQFTAIPHSRCRLVIAWLVNVKGYSIFYSGNRDFRTSASGVDLNRNFVDSDAEWNECRHQDEDTLSKIVTSETYAGPRPFSEPETRALVALNKVFSSTVAYLLHAKGRYVTWAKGRQNVRVAAQQLAQLLRERTGQPHNVVEKSSHTVIRRTHADYFNIIENVTAFTVEIGTSFAAQGAVRNFASEARFAAMAICDHSRAHY